MDWRKKNGKGEKRLLIKNEERYSIRHLIQIFFTRHGGA